MSEQKIICGDSIEVLKTFEAESVDLLCTDPPYGYSFMGKSWDKTLPDIGIFKECFRVLKPGAFAFVMSAPRSDVCAKMMLMLEEAGFEIGFTPVYHTYASGFPKAQNVHKKLTKDQEARKHQVREMWKTLIHSSTAVGESNNGAYLQEVLEDLEQEEQYEISSQDTEGEKIQVPERQRQSFVERWTDLSEKKGELSKCKVCSLPLGLYINGKKRWICYGTSSRDGDVSWTLIDEDGMCTSYKSQRDEQPTGKSNAFCFKCGTQAVRTLESSYGGFQPKPAVEVVIVARKPLSEKTFVDQALKNGKGITWLDDCRIGTEGARFNGRNVDSDIYGKYGTAKPAEIYNKGRFPANLLVSDDVLNDYSRYFSLDSWWTERIKKLPESVQKTFPFLIVPKASKGEKNDGLGGMEEKQITGGGGLTAELREDGSLETASAGGKYGSVKAKQSNFHPTVKPLTLMSYLITLGSREGDLVLDPFVGSGTTAVASKMLGRKCIGIEREKEYTEIAEARLKAVPDSLFNYL